MNEADALISKFGNAIYNEDPDTVISVLVSFTQVFLEQYGVDLNTYVAALRDAAPTPKVTRQ
jgi:hypothetical protein